MTFHLKTLRIPNDDYCRGKLISDHQRIPITPQPNSSQDLYGTSGLLRGFIPALFGVFYFFTRNIFLLFLGLPKLVKETGFQRDASYIGLISGGIAGS